MRNQEVIKELDELASSVTSLSYETEELIANGLDPADAKSLEWLLERIESVQRRLRTQLGL